ncbi:hypothetical protein [Burkholderia ubonensis]|nr:hypothetical protein [Burkholderia ubonensis]
MNTVLDAAKCLALPEATVRSRHHRARRMLRASLTARLTQDDPGDAPDA